MRGYDYALNEATDRVFARADAMGLSNAELALEAGVCEKTVWRLANRITVNPMFRTLYKLAKAVGLDIKLVEAASKKGRKSA